MTITIHRGQEQIGGCITEIATANSRIFIDLGGNLPSNEGEADPLASPEAVAELTKGVDAIFYTHYHGDHVSLYQFVPQGIKQYMGEAAIAIERIKQKELSEHDERYMLNLQALDRFEPYHSNKPVHVGDITVTPYYTSHSAYDAYMFLIEADGKRILHTGDFRGHGYLGKALTAEDPNKNVIQHYMLPVDVLVTEGTMLSRSQEEVHSELQIAQRMTQYMKSRKYVFVLTSSTDIDRIVSIKRACSNLHRRLLCDDYQMRIIDKVRSRNPKDSIYHLDEWIDRYGEDWWPRRLRNVGFCALVRASQYSFVNKYLDELGRENCYLIYSMWKGYYTNPKCCSENIIQLRSLFPAENIEYIHTSGHADCHTLEYVIRLANPSDAIIGIHKEAGTSLTQLELPEDLKARIVPDSVNQIIL